MTPLDPAAGSPLEADHRVGWRRIRAVLVLALLYLGAGRIPLPSGLAFQAYLFWPAASS